MAKPLLLLVGLWPAFYLGYALTGAPELLGANPAQAIIHLTGGWCLKFLLLTVAVTPLRRLTGWTWLMRFRRMLGLFAFFYGVVHFGAYVAFDQYFRFGAIVSDLAKRPFIAAGVAALLLMLPLALTSTRGWIRRFGSQNWNRLHGLVYPAAIFGVLHYWWLVKRDVTWPALYAFMLAVLLGARLAVRLRRKAARRRKT